MSKTQLEAIRDMAGRDSLPEASTIEKRKLEGLELSEIQYKPLSWFKHNPENEIFTNQKKPAYWQALERDIREAGTVLSPLIALMDGLLIEGESRLTIARKLEGEGIAGFDRLPVRQVLSTLTLEEQRKRLYLGNLSRFEIDEDTRAALYAQIWPDLTHEGKPGRVSTGNTATVAVKRTEAVRELARGAGLKERQAWNEAGVIADAARIAREEGAEAPRPEHIRKAREKRNAERRVKAKSTGNVTLRLSYTDAKLTLRILKKAGARPAIIEALVNAIKTRQ